MYKFHGVEKASLPSTIEELEAVLAAVGSENPPLEAQLLWHHIEANGAAPDRYQHLHEHVSLICDGVPVQRQIGYTIVCGRKFLITPDVLLPGPEIDLVLAAFFENAQGATTVVDLCTGCGVLASVIGTTCPSSRVYATDISSGALDVARQNVGSDNVTLLLGDLFDPLRDTNVAPVDALVSNPPYCRTEDIDRLPKQLRDHTPRIAIDGGLDGYAFHRRIIRESAAFVRPRGIIVLENETGQSDEICRMLKAEGWSVVDVRRNDKGEERVVVARRMA